MLTETVRHAGAMDLSLPPGEPAAGPWRAVPVAELVGFLLYAAGTPSGRPRVVAVDGRSAGGKTALATRVATAVRASTVVHTDDIAWNHSFFGWGDLLAEGVLGPVHRGRPVTYRPPAWDENGRPGTVEVPAGLDLVVVEGVGAGRRELAHLVDVVVWVQSDVVEAQRRGIARDVAHGMNGDAEQSAAFWHTWMAEELPFLADQQPWRRACVVVAGTPPAGLDADHVLIAPPPAPETDR
jgi:hypothetical protein